MTYTNIQPPTYDLTEVQHMCDELVAVGFEELYQPEDVDRVINHREVETVLVMINSVCGCSARSGMWIKNTKI